MMLIDLLKLDERLSTIYKMVGRVESVADIGADHGFLGVRLLLDDRCVRVQFLDISELSLKKAVRLAKKCGVFDRCAFSIGDGAKALVEKPDVAVIAGMGGETIARIIREGREALSGVRLILQPNLDAPFVREAVCSIGYAVTDEKIARAKNRHYVIIAAEPGRVEYSTREIIAGPVLLKKGDENLTSYARFRLRVAQKAYEGAKGKDSDVEIEFAKEITIWEEILSADSDRQ